ncbi:hypothetical protein ACIQRS_12730 [Streptomyces termitum]|uniref:hypothetical protein n=1 Tax=Streptomyces termitum TaxID=67368 RepID=UPI00167B1788|nr:hypothetical protein [Streptomyces termitum]
MSDVYDLHIDTDVTVQLDACRREDARAVFELLEHVYRLEDAETPSAEEGPGAATTVWMATFDTSGGPREEVRPAPLAGTVGALLTGGYHAVDEVEKVLAAGFGIESLQSVSGDQETEARLLLASR